MLKFYEIKTPDGKYISNMNEDHYPNMNLITEYGLYCDPYERSKENILNDGTIYLLGDACCQISSLNVTITEIKDIKFNSFNTSNSKGCYCRLVSNGLYSHLRKYIKSSIHPGIDITYDDAIDQYILSYHKYSIEKYDGTEVKNLLKISYQLLKEWNILPPRIKACIDLSEKNGLSLYDINNDGNLDLIDDDYKYNSIRYAFMNWRKSNANKLDENSISELDKLIKKLK